jgi:NhaP-type Na+/H+ or K+/H+ antiporter
MLRIRKDKLARDQNIILVIVTVFCVALMAFLLYEAPPKGIAIWLLFGLLLGGAAWAWFRKELELPAEGSEIFDRVDNKP